MLRHRVVLALVAVQWAATSCAPAQAVPPQSVPATPPTVAAAAAPPLPEAIRWVQGSAEYQAIVRQTYRTATAAVEAAAAGRAASTWGVVLDADETLISNVAYQRERAAQGLGYSPESWSAWVRRREATPLPGAATFLARVRQLGGRIAIVTNRLGSECADTEAVLRRHALSYDVIFCRPDGSPSDKNPRFDEAARALAPAGQPPLVIVAFVGDNILDFPGQTQALRDAPDQAFEPFGSRFIMLPNPMYGSWQ